MPRAAAPLRATLAPAVPVAPPPEEPEAAALNPRPTDGHILGELDERTASTGAIPPAVLERVVQAAPDVLVVLGARVRHGRPGRNLAQRTRTAFRLYEALGRRPLLLLSGGKGEARVMRELLLAEGVPAAQMILETRSRTTDQNARFSMAILERRAARIRSALVVTTVVRRRHGRVTDDHARRALASFVYFSRRVHVAAVSINEDWGIAPRFYTAATRSHAPHRRRHHRLHRPAPRPNETPAAAGTPTA